MTTYTAVSTYTATIYVGTKIRKTGQVLPLGRGRLWLQEYVDRVGLCVTITPTEFLYTRGNEPGFSVGLINYPRFPSSPEMLREHALAIAEGLCRLYEQGKVTVVFPDQTVMVDVGTIQE